MIDMNICFHHIGIACKSIDASEKEYLKMGYSPEGDLFEDSLQGIRGLFMVGGGPRIELLENLDGQNVLTELSKNGDRPYHFAYNVTEDSFNLREYCKKNGFLLIKQPMFSTYFQKNICFLMNKQRMIVELIGV